MVRMSGLCLWRLFVVVDVLEAGRFYQRIALGLSVVGSDHLMDQFGQADLGGPAEFFVGLGWVAEQGFDFGGPVVARVDANDGVAGFALGVVTVNSQNDANFGFALIFKVQGDAEFGSGEFNKLAHAVLHAGSDDEVVWLVLLQHQPLHFDEILGVAPVAQGGEIAEVETFLQANSNAREGARDFSGDEGFAADRAFVVEQDAVTRIDAVGLAVVDGDPVGVELGDGVGAARVEGRCFLLRGFLDESVEFRCGSLVETGFISSPRMRMASSMRSVPSPSALAVYSGVSKLTATWLWAARL